MIGFILYLLIVGLVAGFIARALVPGRDPMSVMGTILLGIVGSFIGGFLGYVLTHHDAQDGAKLSEIPGGTAEEPERRHAVLRRTRAIVQRQHPNQRGFAGAVGPEHGRVFPLSNTHRQALKDAPAATDERRVP